MLRRRTVETIFNNLLRRRISTNGSQQSTGQNNGQIPGVGSISDVDVYPEYDPDRQDYVLVAAIIFEEIPHGVQHLPVTLGNLTVEDGLPFFCYVTGVKPQSEPIGDEADIPHTVELTMPTLPKDGEYDVTHLLLSINGTIQLEVAPETTFEPAGSLVSYKEKAY